MSGFDAFGTPVGQSQSFDPFNNAPPQQQQQTSDSRTGSGGLDNFSNMRSAVPSFEQSQAQGKGGGDFSSFFDSSPSASSGNNQQNGGGEGNPGGGGVPKGGFTSQTSTEFESIFGGGGGDGGGVSVGMGVGFDAGSPSTQHQQQQQGSSSFASFDSAPSSPLPPPRSLLPPSDQHSLRGFFLPLPTVHSRVQAFLRRRHLPRSSRRKLQPDARER